MTERIIIDDSSRDIKVMKSASLTPTIQELIENGDNLSRRWEH